MNPSPPVNYARDMIAKHPVLLCNRVLSVLSSCVHLSNSSHIFTGQFCRPMWLKIGESFIDRIFNVLFAGSKPQMIWSNTCGIISTRTVVTHIHSFRNRAVVKHPHSSVGHNSWHPLLTGLDFSVSAEVFRSNPQPAQFCNHYLFPESITKRIGEALRKCGVLIKYSRHIKSSVFGLLAPWQRKLPGAPSILNLQPRTVNAFLSC